MHAASEDNSIASCQKLAGCLKHWKSPHSQSSFETILGDLISTTYHIALLHFSNVEGLFLGAVYLGWHGLDVTQGANAHQGCRYIDVTDLHSFE